MDISESHECEFEQLIRDEFHEMCIACARLEFVMSK